jgi:hypothetical protein
MPSTNGSIDTPTNIFRASRNDFPYNTRAVLVMTATIAACAHPFKRVGRATFEIPTILAALHLIAPFSWFHTSFCRLSTRHRHRDEPLVAQRAFVRACRGRIGRIFRKQFVWRVVALPAFQPLALEPAVARACCSLWLLFCVTLFRKRPEFEAGA